MPSPPTATGCGTRTATDGRRASPRCPLQRKLRPPASRVAGARKKRSRCPPPSSRSSRPPPPAPDGDEWLHEIKYDGYRIVARIDNGEVRLITRGGLDWADKFRALARALAALPVKSAIIDGELVALRPDGKTSFADLQDAISAGRTDRLTYFAFDLVYRDGWDLSGAGLEKRKAALAELIRPGDEGLLRFSDHHVGRGLACCWSKPPGTGVEGIIAKRRDKPYEPGRSRNWLKVKCRNRDEFIIVGYSDPEGTREHFGSLLLGYYDPKGTLRYAGRVGSGFGAARLKQLHERLEALASRKATVALPAGAPRKGIHWARPELVAEVEYACWTADALIRQSTFQGLREDKMPREIVYDPASPPTAATPPRDPPTVDPPTADPPTADPPAVDPAARSAAPAKLRDGSILFNGVRLSHPDRALYSEHRPLPKLQVAG